MNNHSIWTPLQLLLGVMIFSISGQRPCSRPIVTRLSPKLNSLIQSFIYLHWPLASKRELFIPYKVGVIIGVLEFVPPNSYIELTRDIHHGLWCGRSVVSRVGWINRERKESFGILLWYARHPQDPRIENPSAYLVSCRGF